MRTFLRILKWLGVAIATLLVGLVAFVLLRADRTYEAPFPNITASQDSAVIARGKYLFYGPAHCSGCHAPRDQVAALERGEAVLPSGGEDFYLDIGTLYAPNITSDEETGIGSLTDGEIARALRFGVRHDGRPILDLMPFYDLSDSDLTAVVSYLRTIPAVRNERPEHEWNFLGKALFAFGVIKPMGDAEVPDAPPVDTTVEYGRYLAESIANCRGCHSERDLMTGGYIGPYYAGGMKFNLPDEQGRLMMDKYLITSNLTPAPNTGVMSSWSQEDFIARFRRGRTIPGSIMPWGQFGNMSDVELKALYKFLRSLDPIESAQPIPVGIQTEAAS